MGQDAQKIISLYSEGFLGLTKKECTDAGFSNPQCEVLVEVLGTGIAGQILPEERNRLKKAKFSDEFINDLSGEDGNKAVVQRSKWLAKHINKGLLRWDFDEATRLTMIRELQSMGTFAGHVVPELVEALESVKNEIRVEAAKALKTFGSQAAPAVPAIIKAYSLESDKTSKITLIELLGEIGPPAAMATSILLDIMPENSSLSNKDIYNAARRALAKMGDADPRILPLFIKDLTFDRYVYRPNLEENVILAFKNSSSEGIYILVQQLRDSQEVVRRNAASVLGQLNTHQAAPAIPILRDMSQSDPDQSVQEAARQAIEKLQGEIH